MRDHDFCPAPGGAWGLDLLNEGPGAVAGAYSGLDISSGIRGRVQ